MLEILTAPVPVGTNITSLLPAAAVNVNVVVLEVNVGDTNASALTLTLALILVVVIFPTLILPVPMICPLPNPRLPTLALPVVVIVLEPAAIVPIMLTAVMLLVATILPVEILTLTVLLPTFKLPAKLATLDVLSNVNPVLEFAKPSSLNTILVFDPGIVRLPVILPLKLPLKLLADIVPVVVIFALTVNRFEDNTIKLAIGTLPLVGSAMLKDTLPFAVVVTDVLPLTSLSAAIATTPVN